MHGCKVFWLAGILVSVVICSGPTTVWGQAIQSPYVPGDPAYTAARDLRQPAGVTLPQPANQFVSSGAFNYGEEAGLEDRVADLEANLQAIQDKQAAAKKKAAGKPSLTVGGRVFADWYMYNQDVNSAAQIGDQQNGFRFDTVRLFAKGEAFHVVDYKLQFDFAGTQTDGTGASLHAATFKDVYLGIKELPLLGHVKVGHYKEPFSLDQLTSSRFITFMERSLTDAFSPKRNVGVMAYDHSESENFTWAIGAFISEVGDEPPIFRDDSGGTAMTMRMTYLPWYDEATEGRGLFHLGVCYSYRDIADGTYRFRSRPEADLGSYLIDTGTITFVSDVQLLGLEAAWVYGPFRIQSEYMSGFVDRAGFADPEFDGAYVQASYFLTGEQRKYKRSAGTFSDRVKPYENFFRVRGEDGNVYTGKGAWELAYRCSYIDLNDAGVTGGNATNHTIGLNWYLNPYTRVVWNYVNSDLRRAGITGNMDIFEMRCQIDF